MSKITSKPALFDALKRAQDTVQAVARAVAPQPCSPIEESLDDGDWCRVQAGMANVAVASLTSLMDADPDFADEMEDLIDKIKAAFPGPVAPKEVKGLPLGSILKIEGPERSGKTTLALHAVAEAQREGKVCALIDAEHVFDVSYARTLGIDPASMLICQPEHGDQALEIAETLASSGSVNLIVVDSVEALLPKDSAREALRKIAEIARQTGTMMMVLRRGARQSPARGPEENEPPAPQKDLTKVETMEQLDDVVMDIKMSGTRFEYWSFDWKVEEVLEPTIAVDVETSGRAFSSFDEPRLASMPASRVRGWFLLCSFERPNVDAQGLMGRGYGRRWFVERGSSVEQVVFTCWLAIRQIVEHELHESFTVSVGGRRVRLLDPHKSLEDVAHGSREA